MRELSLFQFLRHTDWQSNDMVCYFALPMYRYLFNCLIVNVHCSYIGSGIYWKWPQKCTARCGDPREGASFRSSISLCARPKRQIPSLWRQFTKLRHGPALCTATYWTGATAYSYLEEEMAVVSRRWFAGNRDYCGGRCRRSGGQPERPE